MKTYTLDEACKKLDICEQTISDLIQSGRLKAFRMGSHYRILEDDLMRYTSETAGQTILSADGAAEDESSVPSSSEQYIICGMDPVLDSIWERLSCRTYDVPLARSYICSYQSLNELYFQDVKAGAAHLIDYDGSTYNENYVRYLLPGVPCALIHLTCRVQGFYVPSGNPKNILGWNDLARPDVHFMNREPGAGVRILIDINLQKHGIPSSRIMGYDQIAHSHLAAASAVARGDCDVSLGAQRTVSQVTGVDFIPLQKERYELVIRKESLEDPQIQDIIKILQSGEIRDDIAQIPGYDPADMGKITIIE
ncbi:MAG: substrate-binding domain-containing protein [Anaerovoracaceae bacterium]